MFSVDTVFKAMNDVQVHCLLTATTDFLRAVFKELLKYLVDSSVQILNCDHFLLGFNGQEISVCNHFLVN